MKPRNDKRISTSFSLAQLDEICCGLSHTAEDDRGFKRWLRMDKLRTKLRDRVALAKLAEART